MSNFLNINFRLLNRIEALHLSIFVFLILVILSLFIYNPKSQPISPIPQTIPQGLVLPVATQSAAASTSALTNQKEEIVSSVSPSRPNVKGDITIAVLGDSMVETLGDGIPQLSQNLAQYYPNVKFNILNYGVGATNITYGLFRLTHDYVHKEKNVPALLSQKPNLIIIDSFAYNHPPNTPDNYAKYQQAFEEIIATLRRESPSTKIAILITIAPDKDTYAANAPNILWSPNQRQHEAEVVKIYLELAQKLAVDKNLIFIDAYHPSLDAGFDGNPLYINQTDNIHPSPEGISLISEQIAKKIFDNAQVETILAGN